MDNLTNKLNCILSNFKIKAECVNAINHKHLSFYDIKLSPGTRIKRIEQFSKEIALELQSKTDPIVTAITEKGIVRLTVANNKPDVIYFNNNKHIKSNGILPIYLGENTIGEDLYMDLYDNPHLLVAGTTGSGKSTFLHLLINNLLLRSDCEFYISDPKGVEFNKYDCNVVSTYEGTLQIINKLHNQMEQRFSLMRENNVSNFRDMPLKFKKKILIIDEVAELMMKDKDKKNINKGQFQLSLVNLAQKCRAVGIFIILATQRPSSDVLTGLIKANFPARLSFKVSSAVDSKIVLDTVGAENLLGYGDGILLNTKNNYTRFQCALSNN
jgi:S-DNA-T family DNA segregation ATPase FtsK/SpoIIIE